MRRLLALALLAALAVGCGSDGQAASSEDTSPPTTAAAAKGFRYGTGECPPATPPAETPHSFDDAPTRCLEDGKDYGATIETSEGTFTVDLAEDTAPGTVNNFVVLARWGWFDGDDFHRVVPGFVAQAGDPFGSPQGTGGPGYSIPDELPATPYEKGTLAMANSGPNTGGSQWFVCEQCSLPPDYPIFGKVVGGMDVVDKIMALGVADGPPSTPVAIVKVTITET